MNDHTSFTCIGDEPVEARIVAWVLGEASAFEAAELQRLCDERPEWLLFRRRMCALHSLLTEAEVPQADDAWLLPPEKRRALDAILGVGTRVPFVPRGGKRGGFRGRRVWYTMAACLLLTLIVGGLFSSAGRSRKGAVARTLSFMRESSEKALAKNIPGEARDSRLLKSHNGELLDIPLKPDALADPFVDSSGNDAPSQGGAKCEEPMTSDGKDAMILARQEPMESDVRDKLKARKESLPSSRGMIPSESPSASAAPAPAPASVVRQNAPVEAKEAEMLAAGSGGGARQFAARGGVDISRKPASVSASPERPGLRSSDLATRTSLTAMDDMRPSNKKLNSGALAMREAGRHDEDSASNSELKICNEVAASKPVILDRERIDEVTAAEDPYSTFSLNLSDASFQVAQAALAKGGRPAPNGIKVEQFYNAVDYGDPSPTAGEPVAAAIEQMVHPVIPGRNLVRVSLKIAASGRSASQPLRLTLLVDQSGSMVREDRRAAMDHALAGLAALLTPNDRVTVVGFARTPRLLADGWSGDQAAKLADLINQSANEGGTNLEEALKLAESLAERHKLAGAQNRIVLLTDGAANLGDADPARLAGKVKALRQKGLCFDIAGIAADDLNDALLGELARHGNGRYYVVGKGADDGFARQLAGAFRPAAENIKVQVRFNPERVARYKLIGFEKDRLHTEDFRNDAVDAAELAAEEAGVAIYQVEPIPGGAGELGDVSVRFRDAASGQMVERTWTIPHDSGAPAIDRAKPSMQLAVLSMFAAEKLRGGPLADAIDFKQWTTPRANVKQFYGNTGRVAEMLRMIDSL